MKKELKEIRIKEEELRKLLNSFEILPGAPENEFDSLNHKLISALSKGASQPEIENLVTKEFEEDFGMDKMKQKSKEIGHMVIKWWNEENL